MDVRHQQLDPELKYALYESSVQTPEQHAELFAVMYADITGRKALRLREDFCGTFRICCEWVKSDPKREAWGLDLDPEPLSYGKKYNLSALKREEARRVHIHQSNVLGPSPCKADLIVACNFSYFIFKQRQMLVDYLKAAYRSLRPQGLFVMELAGGPGMIEKTQESQTMELEQKHALKKARGRRFRYFWQQRNYNPITADGQYSIHFELGDGRKFKDAFTYDWRVWTIPELKDALTDAGFPYHFVYWQADTRRLKQAKRESGGGLAHEYLRTDKGENHYSYVAYIVGQK